MGSTEIAQLFPNELETTKEGSLQQVAAQTKEDSRNP